MAWNKGTVDVCIQKVQGAIIEVPVRRPAGYLGLVPRKHGKYDDALCTTSEVERISRSAGNRSAFTRAQRQL